MRLLTVRHGESFAFTEDLIEDVPPYAILSHTWGHDSQEVTFKDILDGTGRQKEGYRKLQFCCKQAAFDSLDHIWVDTCCIDKTNSVELSEAINSMFQWYANAENCYVYLADVSKSHTEHVEEPLRSTWKQEFRASRWFTRGWTLQELIAPSSVEFFAWNGQRLGDKRSLEQLIHDTTGIAISALRRSPLSGSLSDFSIDERLSWSNGRKTKKKEDKIYSLLGIFNVHMPLIYGEGEQKALARLLKDVDEQSDTTRQRFNKKLALERLPIAVGAAFDSHAEEHNPSCLPGTRVNLRDVIRQWVEDPNANAVFWLNGMAGTGKSTISRTLAHFFSDCGQLGASFFFKRGESDRRGVSKFFTTITAHLVQKMPALAHRVNKVIDDDPGIFGKTLQQQFERLIRDPLSGVFSYDTNAKALVIIIDALDEYDEDEDIKLIIRLLSKVNKFKSLRPFLRIFLTSRPELPIRLGFAGVQGTYHDLVLHEIEETVVKHDLSVYFQYELAKIKEEYNRSVPHYRQLPSTWPEQSEIQTLIEMATPLFIFAATVCRFIAERRTGTPDAKLRKILEHKTQNRKSKPDVTYQLVLDQLLLNMSGDEEEEAVELFQHLVGSIVLLTNPLSTSALANLLDIPEDTINTQLDYLHSVLNISSLPNSPVRLLHLSFRDFLLNSSNESRFRIDEQIAHRRLATHCMRVMNKTLRKDICKLNWPGTRYENIDENIINSRLTPEVQYACQYWAYHDEQAKDCVGDGGHVHVFLQRHYLHWMEALALIGQMQMSRCLEDIRMLESLVESGSCIQASRFVNDALQFIHTNIKAIEAAPLQTYCSALVFAPEESIIRDTFRDDIPDWISGRRNDCLRTMEGHTDSVLSVEFSPDGRIVASGSTDTTVRLWSAAAGELLQTLRGHTGSVFAITFSPDGTIVASGSTDGIALLWSAATGEHLHTLDGHACSVHSIPFSLDGKMIMSASSDDTVRLWLTATGEHLHTLRGHIGLITSVAFSPDGRIIVSASSDGTVRLWSTNTGKCLKSTNLDIIPFKLFFNSESASLLTNADVISLIRSTQKTSITASEEIDGSSVSYAVRVLPCPDRKLSLDYGTKNHWISLNDRDMLWLPEHCRPVRSAVFGSNIAIITSRGKLAIIRFPIDKLPEIRAF
ncbi:vegetative incompatibility protein HET-E-1 [Xylaria sp. FL0933]|nr:vegetative incompatibility protein HET-E-1 [Xylaria sp. FL0933]